MAERTMYIIYDNDGQIKLKNIYEIVVQGSNNATEIFVAFDDLTPPAFALSAYFKLPDNSSILVDPTSVAATREINGKTYYGRVITFDKSITSLTGLVKMNLVASPVSSDDSILREVSYVVYFTVDEGISDDEVAMMSTQQLQNLIDSIERNVQNDETILKIVGSSAPTSTTGYQNGQCMFVCSADHSFAKLYQVNGSSWQEIFDFNDHYTKSQIDGFITTLNNRITSEVNTINGKLATKVDKTTTINGHALGSDVVITKADVGLGNVDNISAATMKSNFTGSIANGNTGFVTGGMVYTALLGKSKVTGEVNAYGRWSALTIDGVRHLIGGDGSVGMTYQVVDELPATGEIGIIYLVPAEEESENNVYNEYIWLTPQDTGEESGRYELIGSTATDLSNYVTNTDFEKIVNDIGDEYNPLQTYNTGSYSIHDNTLYRCNTDNTTGTWDSSKWTAVKIANEFVDKSSAQTIPGVKTFENRININDETSTIITDNDWHIVARANYNFYLGRGTNDYFLWQTGLFAPTNFQNVGADLGSSAQPWRRLYLTDEAYLNGIYPTGNTKNGFTYTPSSFTWNINANFCPLSDDLRNLGASASRWKDAYFSGQVYAQNTFNVINASDISNNTLTQAQYDLITNGKPTLIKGQIGNYNNAIIFGLSDQTTIYCFNIVGTDGYGQSDYGNITLNKSTKSLSYISTYRLYINQNGVYLSSLRNVNGISIPSYPSSPAIPQNFNYLTNNTLAYEKVTKYNSLYEYASNSTTQLEYETINNISISADTTYTLATAPSGTYPEYKGYISNSSGSSKTITLPTSVTKIKASSSLTVVQPTISGGSVTSAGTVAIPDGSYVEFSCSNGLFLALDWNEQ